MLSEQITIADTTAIRRDLEYMTARWSELQTPVMFEVRAFKEGSQPQIGKFAPDWIAEAVEWVEQMNNLGYNMYAVRNPIRATTKGSASDTDVVAAFFLWADCDDPAAAGNVYRFDGPKWSAAVTTGRTPSVRVHTYWGLKEPCTDMAAWRAMQVTIAQHFASDPAVINPSRIMRIGGTVSFPDSRKQSRGYIKEITTINTEYDDARAPVTLDQMARVFGERTPAKAAPQTTTGLQIDTGPQFQTLDRERLAIQAMSGMDWHNAVIRLVASYVGKGLADGEIHALTQPLTLSGYTGDDTAREVQTAIDGARRKGWTPEPAQTYTTNFDHAAASDAKAPEAAKWLVQSADDFVKDFVAPEYLVDGVIQRGRLYTLTAPTGSGKTAVMLYVATAMSMGLKVCDRDTECGDVLYLAGENPDDVRARVIATLEQYGTDAKSTRLHFIAGTFSIRGDMEALRAALAQLPNCTMVIVDTLAAYFDGDDSNSNAQMLDFARVLRKITDVPSKPAVIVPAHPVKNAAKTNLTPMGGSALLNEVDGNLCLWKRETAVEMHWQGKFRGAEFEPISFELVGVTSEKVHDSHGRLMPTVMARPLLETRAFEIATTATTLEDKLILNIEHYEAQSVVQRCVEIGLVNQVGKAKKSSMVNMLAKLEGQKLIQRLRTNWELTAKGQRVADYIKNGGTFATEIE